MTRTAAILMLFFGLLSCRKPEAKPEAVARVETSYLYKSDLKDLVPPGTSKQDSIVIVRSFIDRWASRKLLIKAAEVNLGKEKKSEFDALVKQYKSDLYTKAYIEEIVNRSIDTVVSEAELKQYYDENKDNFRTGGSLVRLRFINVPKDHPKFAAIRSKFMDFRKSDKKFWDTYQVQFKNSALNDSVWVDMGQIYRRLPFINPDNRDRYITPGIAFEHPDGNNTYIVKVRDVIDKNQISPYQYLRPTLEQVILNRRKLALVKQFEKEITDDAIKNEKYEIYK
ncbi:hypothetical protein HYN48_00120 [Flavobacterium magnum]|uniref:Peptidylprolyl isomerase n=1 Tax=Flavobacterium magnum TaxID=2162713 RepID=A0A2S0RD20_9FLAO|nr:hypothetical protein [Flavobacterium magnum]AWA28612.1 hypothetical protein HYN48_00120 [Flavobacterium magnum]